MMCATTVAVESAFPSLLQDGVIDEQQVRDLELYLGLAQEINRGLDQVHIAMDRDGQKAVAREMNRLVAKMPQVSSDRCRRILCEPGATCCVPSQVTQPCLPASGKSASTFANARKSAHRGRSANAAGAAKR